ncbi:amidohydrolase [Lutispora saccharofermentans]|uniref:Amidohydrolase n=1 Tax=Lutispora saccharofermentans TaxID=3024236 RepID=A0ABT1NJT1_9FIRM|nr:amidohydrolase [Lutispora saccharofermentans]MCQ1531533.1 amidohydrolase [Lutispora saccharofermentans]
MNKDDMVAEAMYIKDGKFEKIGANEEMSDYINEADSIIDLENKAVYPGFIDSHMHLAMLGANLYECNLAGVKSKEELIGKVKRYISENSIPSGAWVTGKGWNEDYFDVKELPSRSDLDKISAKHNICLTRGCYHMCVINSRALDSIGINKDNNKIENGIFDIDENGIPTGICRESAMKYVYAQLPAVTKDTIKKYIEIASKYLLSRGITSAQTDDFMLPGVKWQDVIDAYTEMNDEGKLSIRIYEQCLLPSVEELKVFTNKGYRTGKGNEHFKIGPLKILADGNLGTRTAYLKEPYSDDETKTGIPQYTQEKLDDLIKFAAESGMQIAAHSIGDKSTHMLIESIEKLPQTLKGKDLRCNIIHCQITDDEIIDKFKKLDIIANVQPIFLNYDIHMAEARLGHSRVIRSYNWRTLLEKGIKVALGSDSPVELPDTVYGIYSAVTRKDLNGHPEGGWYPDEKLTVKQAVSGFTEGAAYASFEENIKGSIEKGKLADFIISSEDLFEIDPDEIKDVTVLKTYIDGKLVYDADKKDNK